MKILIIDNGTRYLGKIKEFFLNDSVQIACFLDKIKNSSKYNLTILSGNSQYPIVFNTDVFKK